jgi:hypothetical protein
MSLQSFQFFFAQALSQLDADASAIGADGALAVGDTQVFVDYAEPSDLCRVVVDLGPVPTERAAELSRVMLEANCVDATDIVPVFSVHPATGRAVLTLFVPMAGLDAQRHDLAVLLSERVPDVIEGWADMAQNGPPEPPVDGEPAPAIGHELLDRMVQMTHHA